MKNNLYDVLLEHIKKIKIIDTHEHIMSQEEVRRESLHLFRVFENSYARFDFISAGMPQEVWDNRDPKDIWAVWEKYQNQVRLTCFFKNIIRALQDLFGLEENIITKKNWSILSEKINSAYKRKDWYYYVLFKKAGFKISFLDNYWSIEKINFDSQFFLPVLRVNPLILGRNFKPQYPVKRKISLTQVEDLAREWKVDISSFDSYLYLIDLAIKKYRNKGASAIKICTAYERTLYFEKVSKDKAAKLFKEKILSLQEKKRLQDFLTHYIIKKAILENLPIQIHTGTFARNANMIKNGDPSLLNNLFLEYPESKFILFHFSFPFISKAFAIAKIFPNVFLDFCWMPMLSKNIAIKAVDEYFDLIPYNKLMWGGDSFRVEEAYGAACNAREIVSLVLSQRVARGEIDIEGALNIAQAVFHDNAKKIYNI